MISSVTATRKVGWWEFLDNNRAQRAHGYLDKKTFINKKTVQKKRNLCNIDSFRIFWQILASLYVFHHDHYHAHVHVHFLYRTYVLYPMNDRGLPCVHLQMNIHRHDDYLE